MFVVPRKVAMRLYMNMRLRRKKARQVHFSHTPMSGSTKQGKGQHRLKRQPPGTLASYVGTEVRESAQAEEGVQRSVLAALQELVGIIQEHPIQMRMPSHLDTGPTLHCDT
jgi:hypothetical protein